MKMYQKFDDIIFEKKSPVNLTPPTFTQSEEKHISKIFPNTRKHQRAARIRDSYEMILK